MKYYILFVTVLFIVIAAKTIQLFIKHKNEEL